MSTRAIRLPSAALMILLLMTASSGFAQVDPRCDFVELAAGTRHTLGLKSDGTVWAWGDNEWGQLGDSTTTTRSTPVQVLDSPGTGFLSDVVAVAAGGWHSLALTIDGKVYAWGSNALGQLGSNPANPALAVRLMSIPVGVVDPLTTQTLSGIKAIAAGSHHGLALKSDGTVVSWGWNDAGQLGNGTMLTSDSAVQVSGLTQVRAIAAGHAHSLALRAGGTVWAWGYNSNGQLGRDQFAPPNPPNPPVIVLPFSNVPLVNSFLLMNVGPARGIASGPGSNHSLAVMVDGTVRGWGWNESGQLGRGHVADDYRSLEPVLDGTGSPLANVKAIAGGSRHSVALLANGEVSAWGWNKDGQLGYVTPSSELSTTADRVTGASTPYPATAIAAGGMHSASAQLAGEVRVWGDGTRGQLGQGTSVSSLIPVKAEVPCTDTCVSGIGPVAGGIRHSVALSVTGQGLAWGWNFFGQLGNGQSGAGADCAVPMNAIDETLKALNDRQLFVTIASGANHVLALGSDGTVWAWGDNECGQVGNGLSGPGLFSPIAQRVKDQFGVSDLGDVIAIAAGRKHSLALRADGSIWAWGENGSGQLGIGTSAVSALPKQVIDSTSLPLVALAVAAGWAHSLAIAADGTAWGFGSNTTAQLADDPATLPNSAFARQLQDPAFLPIAFGLAVGAGSGHSLLLRGDGSVLSWGANGSSQLGSSGRPNPDRAPAVVDLVAGGTTTARAIATAAGSDHSIAIAADPADAGKVWAWGRGSEGQLGDGALLDAAIPVPVLTFAGPPLDRVRFPGAGFFHSLATRMDGVGFTWGKDDSGQLGDGSPGAASTLASPILMDVPPPGTFGNILRAVKVGIPFPQLDLKLLFPGAPGGACLHGVFRDEKKVDISTMLHAKTYPVSTSYLDAGVVPGETANRNLYFYQLRFVGAVCHGPGAP